MASQAGRLRLLLHMDRPQKIEPAIRTRFPDIEILTCLSYDDLPEILQAERPEAVFSTKFEQKVYPGRAVVESPSVRWIHVGGTGVDHFVPWPPDRLTITNSAGAPSEAIAEYVIGAIYAVNHRLPGYFRAQLRQEWRPTGIRLTRGGTIVVIGLGRIGRAICVRARDVGLRVLGVRSRAEPIAEVEQVFATERITDALEQADYAVVVVPLTDATADLLNREAISALKLGAVLVNVSRGGVVNETALIEALRSNLIRAAVLDVFNTEPLPANSPLWTMENVIVTPHVAGFFDGWETAAAEILCENIGRWISGRPLVNVVDPKRGY